PLRRPLCPASRWLLPRHAASALFCAHLDDLRRAFRRYKVIHVICDNASTHKAEGSRLVWAYLKEWGGRGTAAWLTPPSRRRPTQEEGAQTDPPAAGAAQAGVQPDGEVAGQQEQGGDQGAHSQQDGRAICCVRTPLSLEDGA